MGSFGHWSAFDSVFESMFGILLSSVSLSAEASVLSLTGKSKAQPEKNRTRIWDQKENLRVIINSHLVAYFIIGQRANVAFDLRADVGFVLSRPGDETLRVADFFCGWKDFFGDNCM